MGLGPSKIWRVYRLGLDSKEWDAETVKMLHDEVVKLAGIRNLFQTKSKLKIILIGHAGSGKSSLINSFLAALSGETSNIANDCDRDPHTDISNEFTSYSEHFEVLDLSFNEPRGTEKASTGNIDVDLLNAAVYGKKQTGEKLVPEQKCDDYLGDSLVDEETTHVILFVIDGAAYQEKKEKGEEDQCFSALLDLKKKTDKWNLPRYVLMTHMDTIDPELLEDMKKMHKSEKVMRVVLEIYRKMYFPFNLILPVVNPIVENQKMEDPHRVYFLYLLRGIIKDAKQRKRKWICIK